MDVIKLKKSDINLSPTTVKQVNEALKENQVIVYPTDTLYGLGVDACSDSAIATLYGLKERQNSPVSVLLESTDQLLELGENLSESALELIKKFLPGPLTIICHTQYPFAKQLVSENGTVGFRVPGDAISTNIVRQYGHPITTTSVNPAGATPANSQEEVRAYYGGKIKLMLDIEKIESSRGSTVIDLSQEPFKILREGEISRQALTEYLN